MKRIYIGKMQAFLHACGTYRYNCVQVIPVSCQVPSTNFVKQFTNKYIFIFRCNMFKKNLCKNNWLILHKNYTQVVLPTTA